MKASYRWFNFLFNWLTAAAVALSILLIFSLFYPDLHKVLGDTGNVIGTVVAVVLEVVFISRIINILVGIVLIFRGIKNKKKEPVAYGKRMVIRSTVIAIMIVILFFIVSLALSFYGFSTDHLELPANIQQK